MTINSIIAGLRKAQSNGSELVKNEEILDRLEDGEIFDDYEKDEELPPEVANHIIYLIELD